MVELELRLPKTEFSPGDEVKGFVIFSSDKVIKCKKLSVAFEGQMTLKSKSIGTIGDMVPVSYDTVTSSEITHHEETLILQEASLDTGTQKFGFQFEIPMKAEISCEGNIGSIKYTVKATMNLPWRKKVSSRGIPISIFEFIDDVPDNVTKGVAKHDDEEILEIEIDSQKYCIDDDITFRYRVITDMKFKDLRARIEHIENTFADGRRSLEKASVLCERKIPSEEIILHEWNTMTFKIDKQFPSWLKHKKLESFLVLKVSLTRSLKIDKSAKIELFSGPCSKTARRRGLGPSGF